jgi:hypothetical protein
MQIKIILLICLDMIRYWRKFENLVENAGFLQGPVEKPGTELMDVVASLYDAICRDEIRSRLSKAKGIAITSEKLLKSYGI